MQEPNEELEEALRNDIDFAISFLDKKYELFDSLTKIKEAKKELESFGYQLDLEDLFDLKKISAIKHSLTLVKR